MELYRKPPQAAGFYQNEPEPAKGFCITADEYLWLGQQSHSSLDGFYLPAARARSRASVRCRPGDATLPSLSRIALGHVRRMGGGSAGVPGADLSGFLRDELLQGQRLGSSRGRCVCADADSFLALVCPTPRYIPPTSGEHVRRSAVSPERRSGHATSTPAAPVSAPGTLVAVCLRSTSPTDQRGRLNPITPHATSFLMPGRPHSGVFTAAAGAPPSDSSARNPGPKEYRLRRTESAGRKPRS